MDAYELFYKGKIWLMLGLMGLVFGGALLLGGIGLEGYSVADGMIFGGICILCASIYSIYYSMHYKERVSAETYDQMLFIRNCKALCDESDTYLAAFEKDSDYVALKELFRNLPSLYNAYGSAVISAPLQLTKPVSPYSAAQLGTMMGGVAVGLVAAQTAYEKQIAYEQNVKEVIDSNLKIGNARDKVTYCYLSIEAIIEQKESIKADWQSKKEAIKAELDSQYRV